MLSEPHQQSPMRCALSHERHMDQSSEESAINKFLVQCRDGTLTGYPRYDQPNRPFEGTLCHRLAVEKLKSEARSVERQRQRRHRDAGYQGCTLRVHLGNLAEEIAIRRRTRIHKNQQQVKKDPKPRRAYANDQPVDEESDVDDSEEETLVAPGSAYCSPSPTVPPITAALTNASFNGSESSNRKRFRDSDDEESPLKACKRAHNVTQSTHPVNAPVMQMGQPNQGSYQAPIAYMTNTQSMTYFKPLTNIRQAHAGSYQAPLAFLGPSNVNPTVYCPTRQTAVPQQMPSPHNCGQTRTQNVIAETQVLDNMDEATGPHEREQMPKSPTNTDEEVEARGEEVSRLPEQNSPKQHNV